MEKRTGLGRNCYYALELLVTLLTLLIINSFLMIPAAALLTRIFLGGE